MNRHDPLVFFKGVENMTRRCKTYSFLSAVLAFLLTVCFLAGGRVYAASSPFSVTVGDKIVSFQKDGLTTGSYKMSRNDIVLVTDSSDDLLVCFYNTDGQYVGVTLGSQENVTLNGSINSLTLHKELDRNVIIGSKCTVSSMTVNTPVKVSVYGTITDMEVKAGASVIAVKGCSIDNIDSTSTAARLTVQNGAVVRQSSGIRSPITVSSGTVVSTTVSDSDVTFRTEPIYAEYGDRLREYTADLQASVKAYYQKKRITGEVEWTLSGSSTLNKSGSYRFRFTPDNSKLDPAYGYIRILVDDGEDSNLTELDLDIRTITVEYNTNRLGDLKTKLRQSVTAYDVYGKKVEGTLRWVDEDTRVRKSGYYDFLFIPTSPKYNRVQDSVKIQIESEDIIGDSNELVLEVVDIDTTSTRKRLRNFTTQLQANVTAYDANTGEEVNGKVNWTANTMTLVTETEEFEFRFVPDDKSYSRTTGTIIIYVDD